MAWPLRYVATGSQSARAVLGSDLETRPLLLTALVAITVRLALAGLGGLSGALRDILEPETFQYLLLVSLAPLPLALLVLRLQARDTAGRWIAGPAGRRLTLEP